METKIGKRSAAAEGSKHKPEPGPAPHKKIADRKKDKPHQSPARSPPQGSPQKVKVVANSAPGPRAAPAGLPLPNPGPEAQAGPQAQMNGGSLPHPRIEDMSVQYKLNVATNNGGMLRVAELRAQLRPGQPAAAERPFRMPDKLPLESQKPFKHIRCAQLTQTDDRLQRPAAGHEAGARGVPQQRVHPRGRLARQVREPRRRGLAPGRRGHRRVALHRRGRREPQDARSQLRSPGSPRAASCSR